MSGRDLCCGVEAATAALAWCLGSSAVARFAEHAARRAEMVKGNFERRRELAAQRKQDRKDEVMRQKAGAIAATPVEVRGRLLHDARVAGARDDELLAWVVAPARPESIDGDEVASRRDAFRDGGVGTVVSRKDVCEAWWRTGFCEMKRCRLSHADSISHIKGVPEFGAAAARVGAPASNVGDGGDDGKQSGKKGGRKKGKKGAVADDSGAAGNGAQAGATLPAMDCVLLKTVDAGGQLEYDRSIRTQRRQESPLLFIAFRGELVYDKFNPEVFASYAAKAQALAPLTSEAGGDRRHLGQSPARSRRLLGGHRASSVDRRPALCNAVLRGATPDRGNSNGNRGRIQPSRAPSPAMVALGMRNIDQLEKEGQQQRAASPLPSASRPASAPLRRSQSPFGSNTESVDPAAVAAAMWHVSKPSLSCRRCGVDFATVDALRIHFRDEHRRTAAATEE